jgi:hypothetical protein
MTLMARKPKDDSAQMKAFRKAAREAGADDNEERFQEALRKITKRTPQDSRARRPRSRDRD